METDSRAYEYFLLKLKIKRMEDSLKPLLNALQNKEIKSIYFELVDGKKFGVGRDYLMHLDNLMKELNG